MNNGYLVYFGGSVADRPLLDALARETGTRDSTASDLVAEALRLAKDRIFGLDAIGLTERFPELVQPIFMALGLSPPRSIVSAMVTDELPNSGSGFSPVRPVTITPRLLRALRRLTETTRSSMTSQSKNSSAAAAYACRTLEATPLRRDRLGLNPTSEIDVLVI